MLTINNTVEGYLKNVEIKGNTIQNPANLADIKSVGDKVEGQELHKIPLLSVNGNLFRGSLGKGSYNADGYFNKNESTNTIGMIDYVPIQVSKNMYINSFGKRGFRGGQNTWVLLYDSNKNYLSKIAQITGDPIVISNSNAKYMRILLLDEALEIHSVDNYVVSITVDKKATTYEAYKEDKLTILSPVQLEKVGDVRDIIYENGDIDKNILNEIVSSISGASVINVNDTTDGVVLDTARTDIKYGNGVENIVLEGFKHVKLDSDRKAYTVYSNTTNRVACFPKGTLLDDMKKYLIGKKVKYQLVTTQKHKLPHAQQIKLRTFANKTNISFLTEIEGTIKADVPKSLGATVNVHTKEIDNIYTELDRVKKLEQSTVSTVTTDKDFVSVQETSNGYFEDVELKGRTLVNKIVGSTGKLVDTQGTIKLSINGDFESEKVYTVVFNIDNETETTSGDFRINKGNTIVYFARNDLVNQKGLKVVKFTSPSTVTGSNSLEAWSRDGLRLKLSNIVIIEGDHTQNPPSYFQGLASVGDGTDEIVVSTCKEVIEMEQGTLANADGSPVANANRIRSKEFIIGKGFEISNIDFSKFDVLYMGYDENKKHVNSGTWVKENKPLVEYPYIKIAIRINDTTPITPSVLRVPICIIGRNADKKKLLYLDPVDNTWKKPIIDEFSTVKKGADGVYRYYVRGTKYIINGSETTYVSRNQPTNTNLFRISLDLKGVIKKGSILVCNSLPNIMNNNEVENIYCHSVDGNVDFIVAKSKASDLNSFKSYASTNNFIFVGELATEKVYECTNIDLITYKNETNFNVKSGVLSPKTTLKVHSNISNVVSLLQKKVSILESSVSKYMITQNRLMLTSRYNADKVTFKVDYNSANAIEEKAIDLDYDLYNLLMHNVVIGKDNYNYDEMIAIMDFYVSVKLIDWDMWDEIWLVMELQHNPPVEEVPSE